MIIQIFNLFQLLSEELNEVYAVVVSVTQLFFSTPPTTLCFLGIITSIIIDLARHSRRRRF